MACFTRLGEETQIQLRQKLRGVPEITVGILQKKGGSSEKLVSGLESGSPTAANG
jgi:hypothetical protein